ncbi:MAG: STAS domain-containing protein [Syntrophothermus sp.]
MEIREKQTGGVYIIEVEGKLDSKTSSQMEKCLVSAIDNGNKEIILDFTSLDFISSAGLRVLLIGVKKLKLVNGKIVLVSVKDYIK